MLTKIDLKKLDREVVEEIARLAIHYIGARSAKMNEKRESADCIDRCKGIEDDPPCWEAGRPPCAHCRESGLHRERFRVLSPAASGLLNRLQRLVWTKSREEYMHYFKAYQRLAATAVPEKSNVVRIEDYHFYREEASR